MRSLVGFLILFLAFGTSAWAQSDASSPFPTAPFIAPDFSVKPYTGWKNDLKLAKKLKRDLFTDYVNRYRAEFEAKNDEKLDQRQLNIILSRWIKRTEAAKRVEDAFPESKLPDSNYNNIVQDLDALVVETKGLSPNLLVGRAYPQLVMLASETPVKPFKIPGRPQLEVWKMRMKDFVNRFTDAYVDAYSNMRGLPKEVFRAKFEKDKIYRNIDKTKDLWLADAMESGIIEGDLQRRLEGQGRGIDRAGYPYLASWFNGAKEKILSQYRPDTDADGEEIGPLEERLAAIEGNLNAAGALTKTQEFIVAESTIISVGERLKRLRVVMILGFMAMIGLTFWSRFKKNGGRR